MKALILNGKVIDIASSEFEVHDSMSWIDSPDDVQYGWFYDGTFFIEPLKPDTESYNILRAREYPPITDYIDGIVKNDQIQIDLYIAKCQAIKLKYPKP